VMRMVLEGIGNPERRAEGRGTCGCFSAWRELAKPGTRNAKDREARAVNGAVSFSIGLKKIRGKPVRAPISRVLFGETQGPLGRQRRRGL
jgi:hypothetical protein